MQIAHDRRCVRRDKVVSDYSVGVGKVGKHMLFRKVQLFMAMALAVFLYAPTANAYIDPGMTYMVLQGLFVAIFGGMVAWVMRPWVYLKNLFGKGDDLADDNTANTNGAHESTSDTDDTKR